MSMLLSEEFEEVMAMALISPAHEVDGDDETFEFLWEVEPSDGPIIEQSEQGYAIQAVETADDAAVVLRDQSGDICGFYYRFMSWIDPDHRGLGLGVDMIMAYASHFQDLAWAGEFEECVQGLGFSPKGYSIHKTAQRIARTREVVADANAADSLPALAFC